MGLILNNLELNWKEVIFLPKKIKRHAARIPFHYEMEYFRHISSKYVLYTRLTFKPGDIVIKAKKNLFPCQKTVFQDMYKIIEEINDEKDETLQDT